MIKKRSVCSVFLCVPMKGVMNVVLQILLVKSKNIIHEMKVEISEKFGGKGAAASFGGV